MASPFDFNALRNEARKRAADQAAAQAADPTTLPNISKGYENERVGAPNNSIESGFTGPYQYSSGYQYAPGYGTPGYGGNSYDYGYGTGGGGGGGGGGGLAGPMAPPASHPGMPAPGTPGVPNGAMAPPNAHPTGGIPTRTPNDVDWIDAYRQRQLSNLDTLTDAALGRTPSAAEILGQQMAARGAAQQYGLAAALQGGHSAAGALRRAQMGSADIAARAREDAMAQRAQEMAVARNQLTNALTSGRGAEQDLRTTQAQLNQRNRDVLLDARLRALGLQNDLTRAQMDKAARDQASSDNFLGSLFQTGAGLAGLYFGGPAGAAVGSKIGGAVGNKLGNQGYGSDYQGAGDDLLAPTSF